MGLIHNIKLASCDVFDPGTVSWLCRSGGSTCIDNELLVVK